MMLPYPIYCKVCHRELTTNADEICNKCFIKLGHKEKIKCPNCGKDIYGAVVYAIGKRIVYYKCKDCGYVILDKNSFDIFISIEEIKNILL